MPRGESHYAEDSCLKDHSNSTHPHTHVPSDPPRDVEKTGIDSLDRPTPGSPVVETSQLSSNEADGPQDLKIPDSDSATLTNEEDIDSFPEGGLKGWSVVVGSFCGSFSVFGIINSTAVLLDYFSANQLKDYDPSQIGWIFGLSLFLTFFCGAPIGPIFDAYGPRALIFSGSILLVASMFLLGLCTRKFLIN